MRKDEDDIFFNLSDGTEIKLVWTQKEYRAFRKKFDSWVEMKLGANNPDSLKKYILNNFGKEVKSG